MNPNVVTANRVGWVKPTSLPQCQALTPGCRRTPTHDAWRWTGRSWTAARIDAGTDVYVYPYSSPWHWIWTQQTGWLAIHNSGYNCLRF